MIKSSLALTALMLLSACNPVANTKAAERGVADFHTALDAGRLDQIYADPGPDLKDVTSREEFTKLLAAIHKKLGNFRTGKTIGWNVNSTTGGTYVTLNREAQFERGSGTEEFVFRVADDEAALTGYHINSNTLITG